MNTEITDIGDDVARPVVLYDGACHLCRAAVRRWRLVLESRGVAFEPLQSDWSRARLGLAEGEIPAEMKLMLPGHITLGGYRAIAWIARRIWWLAWAGWLMELPGLRWISDRGYRWVARNRTCLGDVCALPTTETGRHHRAKTFFEAP